MIIETPYTTDPMVSMSNSTINCKNSFTIECLMGVNFKVVKLERRIVFAHVTSLLVTQH
jgi:hypothetical protein